MLKLEEKNTLILFSRLSKVTNCIFCLKDPNDKKYPSCAIKLSYYSTVFYEPISLCAMFKFAPKLYS